MAPEEVTDTNTPAVFAEVRISDGTCGGFATLQVNLFFLLGRILRNGRSCHTYRTVTTSAALRVGPLT